MTKMPPCMRVTVEEVLVLFFSRAARMIFSKLLRRCRWLFALVLVSQAHATNFTPDPKIQQIAEAYALDARDFAERAFHITLDWSDASVQQVEVILDN